MYWNQAMKEPDRAQFLKAAAVAEVKSHVDNKHFILMPKGTKVLSAVWSMKRKRRIMLREVYKWKTRLKMHTEDSRSMALTFGKHTHLW
jgi:hypothetical protein